MASISPKIYAQTTHNVEQLWIENIQAVTDTLLINYSTIFETANSKFCYFFVHFFLTLSLSLAFALAISAYWCVIFLVLFGIFMNVIYIQYFQNALANMRHASHAFPKYILWEINIQILETHLRSMPIQFNFF